MTDQRTTNDATPQPLAADRAVAQLSDEEFLQYMGAPALTDEDVRALNAL